MALNYFQRVFGDVMPTDNEFLACDGTKITNTVDGSDRITKKSYEVRVSGSTYRAVWEVNYVYTSSNTTFDSATSGEPTT